MLNFPVLIIIIGNKLCIFSCIIADNSFSFNILLFFCFCRICGLYVHVSAGALEAIGSDHLELEL